MKHGVIGDEETARPSLTRRENVTSEIRCDNLGKIRERAESHGGPAALKGDATLKSPVLPASGCRRRLPWRFSTAELGRWSVGCNSWNT